MRVGVGVALWLVCMGPLGGCTSGDDPGGDVDDGGDGDSGGSGDGDSNGDGDSSGDGDGDGDSSSGDGDGDGDSSGDGDGDGDSSGDGDGDGDSSGDGDGDGDGDGQNPCDAIDCGAHGQCVVDAGGVACDCDAGFEAVADVCVDIDECSGQTDCDDNADCINTDGGYQCQCMTDYVGDGTSCAAASCNVFSCDNGGACGVDGGLATCDCAGTGYEGPRCTMNVDECAIEADDCDARADCADTVGSFVCTCQAPYEGDGQTCECPEGQTGEDCVDCDTGYTRDAEGACVPAVLLTLTFEGDGFGEVTVDGLDRGCSEDCELSVPAGPVVLTATPRNTSKLIAWAGACSGTDPDCDDSFETDQNISIEFELTHNIVFVTSTTIKPGELGGLAAGDARCEQLAAAAGLHATQWRAGLGSAGPCPGAVSGDCSLHDRLAGARGWVNLRGEEVFDELSDVLGFSPAEPMWYPPIYKDTGDRMTRGEVFTGLRYDGEPYVGYTCDDYTTTAQDEDVSWGRPSELGRQFIAHNRNGACNYAYAHYCFSVDHDTELTLTPGAGRIAFVSATTFTPGGGLDAADALCQRDACDAGLTGSGDCDADVGSDRTFKAFLATSGASAGSRFDPDGPDYYRLDGVHFLEASTLSTEADYDLPFHTALQERIDGVIGETDVWTGISNGPSTSNCQDWTTAADGETARRGGNIYVAPWSVSLADRGCQYPARLYCYEE